MRLSQLARKLNVGIATIVDFLISKGYEVESKPNTKISDEQIVLLNKEFAGSVEIKQAAEEIEIKKVQSIALEEDKKEEKPEEKVEEVVKKVEEVVKPKEEEKVITAKLDGPKVLGKVDLTPKKKAEPKKEEPKVEEKPKVVEQPKKEEPKEIEKIGAKADKLSGPTVLGKIDPTPSKPKKKEQPKKVEEPKKEVAKETPKAVEKPKVAKEEPKVEEKPKAVEQPKKEAPKVESKPAAVSAPKKVVVSAPVQVAQTSGSSDDLDVKISPLARKLANEKGLNISQIKGTKYENFITLLLSLWNGFLYSQMQKSFCKRNMDSFRLKKGIEEFTKLNQNLTKRVLNSKKILNFLTLNNKTTPTSNTEQAFTFIPIKIKDKSLFKECAKKDGITFYD